jgi:ATP-dependent Clp protease adaptor protein ClpS
LIPAFSSRRKLWTYSCKMTPLDRVQAHRPRAATYKLGSVCKLLIGSYWFPIVLRELGTRHDFPRQMQSRRIRCAPFQLQFTIEVEMPPTKAAPEVETKKRPEMTPLYHVVLLDDDEHTYDYVVEMLTSLFFLPGEEAFRHAVEVDTTGRTIVITCEREQAEFGRDQIQSYGADPRMAVSKGSMSAVVEPAAKT